MKPWVIGASAMGLVAIGLSGCGAATSASAHKSAATVVVAMTPQSSPNWFFPVISSTSYTEINAQVQYLMYKPLINLNKTNEVDYATSLAQRIRYNPEGTQYTITLGTRYKWSNGQPVTAQDVVFTWDLIKAAAANGAPWVYGASGSGGVPSDWKTVKAVGTHTVVITLNKPANPQWFIHNGLSQITPVPKSVWDKYPGSMTQELKYILKVSNSPTNPAYDVVDGPFKFQSWQPNDYWAFVPNPSYGGHKATIGKLEFAYESSASSEFTGLKTGTVDVGYLPPSLWNTKKELASIDDFSTSYLFGMNYLLLNMNPKAPGGIGRVFQHRYVRQALEMGIDQKGIIDSLYHGLGVATDGPVPAVPHTAFYDPALNTPLYPYNPVAGEKLLEEHGWSLVNGVMTKNGQKLAFPFIYVSGSQTVANMAQLLKTDWAKEGIQVSLQSLPLDELLGEAVPASAGRWAMAYWGAGWTYQLDYYPTGGNLFASGAGENSGSYDSRTMNALIQATYEPGTPTQIQSRMDAYEQWAAKDLPVLWMPWFPQGYAREVGLNVHAKNVHGTVSTFNPVTDFLYAQYWTVSQ
ncbi:peptide ABC transporter substrate-binding protein [Sulfobacillus sp. hq2]|uniref:ABC transporter substrate-binding protein n=1 Tax=Sulfobacillus thermotolerans TaxID=338644 RepID=A0ABM6RQF1_9FIRM|nr:peptide ABC transporter substrate-binding protein [Sulfobacillus sp. hq2]AUW93584.1 ABC transporter substrate-binding protein [Sulfobacillus thermotolerans]MCY0907077.1 peptide ABC transporter substrate-binding protein [Sulfobacillus thermotolerans]POB10835.1 ABC transporter substrate-binding protein [Sulfobacillus sp. hq2]